MTPVSGNAINPTGLGITIMKPFDQYKSPEDFMRDARAEDPRRPLQEMMDEWEFVRRVNFATEKIVTFMKEHLVVSRSNLYRSLRLDRAGTRVMDAALMPLYESGRISISRQKVAGKTRARRAVLLAWNDLPDAQTRPESPATAAPGVAARSLDELIDLCHTFSDLEPKIADGYSQESSIEIAGAVMEELLKPNAQKWVAGASPFSEPVNTPVVSIEEEL